MNYNSPSEIQSILEEYNISLKKRWGQNFLINKNSRKKILDLISPQKDELIWEIGPGLGAITNLLLKSKTDLVAFEIDWGLVKFLNKTFSHFSNFTIIQGDVIKTWQQAIKKHGIPQKVCGNLPFASSSAIILSFMQNGFFPAFSVFTVQHELAARMLSLTREKTYSSFSVISQFFFSITIIGNLSAGSFYPAPGILSTIITLTPAQRVIEPVNRDFFLFIVKTSFVSRRKTLLNNLLSSNKLKSFSRESLGKILNMENISLKIRGEELTVEQFIKLSNRIYKFRADSKNNH